MATLLSSRSFPTRNACLLAAITLLFPTLACSGGAETREPAPDSTAAETQGGESQAAPPPQPPVGPLGSSGRQQQPSPAAGGAVGTLVWALPDGWDEVAPSNAMRTAQAVIPGDAGPADLVLFHFGPGRGGDAQSNIQRWLGQMEIEGEPEQGSFDANGLAVTWVNVAGTQKPSQMGTGPTEPIPGSRLLGAVIEGPGGPWFFKVTGPEATVTAARNAFLDMLHAARVE